MSDPIRLSPSTLDRLAGCAHSVYLEKVLKWPSKTDMARLIGSAVHRTYVDDVKEKHTEGAIMSDEALVDHAADSFDYGWNDAMKSERLVLTPDEAHVGEATVRGTTKDTVIQLARKVHESFSPRVKLASVDDVERPVTLNIRGSAVIVRGRLDVYQRPRAELSDLKTRAKKPNESDLGGSTALAFYGLAMEKAGMPLKTVGVDVVTKTKTPKAWKLRTSPPQDYRPLLQLVEQASKVFESGVFYPTAQSGPTAWRCSPKGCDHFDRCPFGKARRATFAAVSLEEA